MHSLLVKKVHVLNKGIIHLIDNIFWNCGFKTESHGDQVIIVIIVLYFALLLLLDLLWLFYFIAIIVIMIIVIIV